MLNGATIRLRSSTANTTRPMMKRTFSPKVDCRAGLRLREEVRAMAGGCAAARARGQAPAEPIQIATLFMARGQNLATGGGHSLLNAGDGANQRRLKMMKSLIAAALAATTLA